MATKKQLIDRWNQPPWDTVNSQITDFIHKRRDLSFDIPFDKLHDGNISELHKLLIGLPFSEEISMHDFRGSAFSTGLKLILADTDFSFCPKFAHLIECKAKNIAVNGISNAIYQYKGIFESSSFKNSNFKQATLSNSTFIECDFTGSRMEGISASNSRFINCNFENVNFYFSSFAKSDLRGSNFRGANLSDCNLNNIIVDKTTDFRGAKIFDMFPDKEELWKNGLWDETTKSGINLASLKLKYLKAIIATSNHVKEDWIPELVAECKSLIREIDKDSSLDWEKVLLEKFASNETVLLDIMKDAGKML